MGFFYILKSKIDNSLYFGSTNNIKKRLFEHNSGKSKYTNNKKPWGLIYCEIYTTLKKARYREWKVKNSAHEYR